MNTTRTAIAKALDLSVVDTITDTSYQLDPFEYEPPTLTALQAWPVWISSTWMNRCVIQESWAVLVLLPSGETATWTDAAESLIGPVREALENVGHVSLVEPVTVSPSDSGAGIPALRFTLTNPGS